MKGVRSGVERRRGRGLKARGGRRDAPGKVLKESAFATPTRSYGNQCEIERARVKRLEDVIARAGHRRRRTAVRFLVELLLLRDDRLGVVHGRDRAGPAVYRALHARVRRQIEDAALGLDVRHAARVRASRSGRARFVLQPLRGLHEVRVRERLLLGVRAAVAPLPRARVAQVLVADLDDLGFRLFKEGAFAREIRADRRRRRRRHRRRRPEPAHVVVEAPLDEKVPVPRRREPDLLRLKVRAAPYRVLQLLQRVRPDRRRQGTRGERWVSRALKGKRGVKREDGRESP